MSNPGASDEDGDIQANTQPEVSSEAKTDSTQGEQEEIERPEEENQEVPQVTLYGAYYLGAEIRTIRWGVKEGLYYASENAGEDTIRSRMASFYVQARQSNLNPILISNVGNTINYIDGLLGVNIQNGEIVILDDKESVSLPENEKNSLSGKIDSWESMLARVLKRKQDLSIRQNGTLDHKQLISDPRNLFHDDEVWEGLSEETQSDLVEAIGAVAMSLQTSGVMISLRAVERRLQDWYTETTGREVESRTFGQALGEMNDHFESRDGEEVPAIINQLHFLAARRNQVAHPQRRPSLQEADSTLIMVRETLSEIHDELN